MLSPPSSAQGLQPVGHSTSRAFTLALVLLAALAVVYAGWPLWRALFPLEIDVDDVWNAFNADAAFRPRALYPNADELIANNYPPLSFLLIGFLSKLTVDATYVGRALSLVAVAVTSLSVALCIRQLGGNTKSAALGALWFLATMVRFYENYVGKNDPHLPAVAIAAAGLAWFLMRHKRGRPVEPAILLMAVAGFYKHSVIATPAAALLWLATINVRLALRAALVGVIAAAAGLALCVAAYGPAFIDQLLFPRYYSLTRVVACLGRTQWIVPALIIWAIWAWFAQRSAAKRFTVFYAGLGLLIFAVTSSGEGVGDNSQFELVVATAIGLGLAFDEAGRILMQRCGMARIHPVFLAALILRLLVSSRAEAYLVLTSSEYRGLFPAAVAVMEREVVRISAVPGPVACTVMTVCRRAGKAFVWDHFATANRIRTGRVTEAEFAAKFRAQNIRAESIDPRAAIEPLLRRF
ncbi:MAG TPA: hypothetical protein VEM36_12085 [Xanthobacteraceae bacterium]|nr:hypothetical protein [Xanthobacteraceae bacterium]